MPCNKCEQIKMECEWLERRYVWLEKLLADALLIGRSDLVPLAEDQVQEILGRRMQLTAELIAHKRTKHERISAQKRATPGPEGQLDPVYS